ncbi:MAG: hypothetical protein CUN49_08845 [Candidatus Thermofonsia Clade 1 bacterium]|jgi:hypothetical protein|uniref:Uncharacterized protein n=1 Tax=Candidatus Thermofonsia Clade 1 bacterium TaxID=2364210 RepID=A0A2M8Q0Y1_9CHLR|nr:MAG: hypothetical protein CUN49_08845 [Candidatus Thermofonsia Clade 1 bacterium]PJF43458.1 MAG: hypothetical protein CUN50_00620 [Candidatus Thermofonsia Clade 1 bacterium]RMF50704.1 MAG: hypothetical protein D6749_09870 [Chloroflexota bacterium]
MWRKHFVNLGTAFIAALIGTLIARWFLAGGLLEFFQARVESPETALNLATLLFGALLFALFALNEYLDSVDPQLSSDQVRVRRGRGVLFLDAASVCDQVFIATSKVQQVKCSEVEVRAVNGDAHISLRARVDNILLLQRKHAELRVAIREMAKRLHIKLGAEPIIYASLPPLRSGRTLTKAPRPPLAAAFSRRSESSSDSHLPNILGRPSSNPRPTTPPASSNSEMPMRPTSSIFSALRRNEIDNEPAAPSQSDDEAPRRASGFWSVFGRRPEPDEPDAEA